MGASKFNRQDDTLVCLPPQFDKYQRYSIITSANIIWFVEKKEAPKIEDKLQEDYIAYDKV